MRNGVHKGEVKRALLVSHNGAHGKGSKTEGPCAVGLESCKQTNPYWLSGSTCLLEKSEFHIHLAK